MPNWVLTNAHVSGDGPTLQRFLDRFRTPDGNIEFKFEKIIPMPKELDQECDSWSETGAIYVWLTEHPGELPPAGLLSAKCEYESFAVLCEKSKVEFERADEPTRKRMIEDGRKGIDRCIKYGAFSWYDWCCNNWGTKWEVDDAYVQEPLDSEAESGFVCLSFQTAWSFPAPIFLELSKLYPTLRFECEYADEDYGSNCGEYIVENRKTEYVDHEGNNAFAYKVWDVESESDEDDEEEL